MSTSLRLSALSGAVVLRSSTVLLACVLACGGGGDSGTGPVPPPVVPVVTTVQVTPSTSSIVAGDSVQLSARVKDQTGATMNGKAVTWSSSNPSVATVTVNGLVAGVAQGQVTITATVEGKQGSAQLTVAALQQITLDAVAAKVASVSVAGGRLTTTSSAGLTYVLDIPEDALDAPVSISMTPVALFRQLPYSGGVVGAVELAPVGLRFKRPAILRIKTTPNVAAGKRLVAMYYDSDGARVVPGPAASGGGEVVVMLSQIGLSPSLSAAMPDGRTAVGSFIASTSMTGGGNGAGAALATPQDLSNSPWPPTSTAAQVALGQLAGLTMPADQAAIVAAMHAWFLSMIPQIKAASTDLQLRDALIEYLSWDTQFFLLVANDPTHQLLAALTPDFQSGESELLTSFRFVSNNLNLACTSSRSLVAANNILDLYGRLQYVDRLKILETPGTGYPKDDVLDDLCLQVIVTDSTLVDPLQKNVSAPLDLRFGVKFGTDPNVSATIPFHLELTLVGTTQDGTTKVDTDPLGKYHTSLTATGKNNVIVSVFACIDQAAGSYLDDVCVDVNLTREMGRTVTGDVTITSDAGLAQIADVSRIVGSLTISGANVSSTDLRELPMLIEVTKAFTVSNLPSLTTLTGLTSLAKTGSLVLTSNPLLKGPTLPPRLTDLALLNINGGGLNDLGGFSGLTHIGFLALSNVAVATLDPLRRTFVDGSLSLSNLAALTSLDGLRVAPTLVSLALADLPSLADMKALDAVSEVQQLTALRVHFPTATPFPKLQKVSITFSLFVDPQTPSLTFPLLQIVQILRVDLHSGCQGRSSPFALGLPVLQSLEDLNWAGPQMSAIGCFILPALFSTLSLQSAVVSGGGFTSLTLNHVQNSAGPNSRGGNLEISGPDVTQIRVSGTVNIAGDLRIQASLNLRSISFGASVTIRAVSGDRDSFAVCDNPALTSISLAAPAQVIGGKAIIAGNPNFVRPPNFPLTATGGVIIQSGFHPLC